MTHTIDSPSHLSDDELLAEVRVAAGREREATARLIALLAELDARRLYLGEGCSSLFTYCTQVLHLSEHAAYGRIEVARAARRCPGVLDLLNDGSVTLTTVTLLSPHLTADNHLDLLNEARYKSKRDVEHIVARLRPLPAAPATVRKLPEPKVAQGSSVPVVTESHGRDDSHLVLAPSRSSPRPAVVMPVAPERYKVQFTVSRDTHDKLRRVQDLLRHSLPNGDPAEIIDRALTVLLADLEQAKLAATARPRGARPAASRARHIPAAVKREVWKRDGGQCAFIGSEGRCRERGFLEFHHVQPYADGGTSVVDNLEIRCRAHNVYEAEQYFGSRLPLLVRESRPAYGIATRSGPSSTSGDRHRLTEDASWSWPGARPTKSLWKLPEPRTRMACVHRSLENYRTVFHSYHRHRLFLFRKSTFSVHGASDGRAKPIAFLPLRSRAQSRRPCGTTICLATWSGPGSTRH
jgi:hypothetical protein